MKRIAPALLTIVIIISLFVLVPDCSKQARASTLHVGGPGQGNYTTIQSAVDAASPGDTIRVHEGTYNEHVIIGKSLDIVGSGADTTIIENEGGGHALNISADWVSISGITILMDADYSYEAAISLFNASWCVLTKNNVSNHYSTGILLQYSHNNVISENMVTRSWYGIQLEESDDNLIEGNILTDDGNAILLHVSNGNTVVSNNASANHRNGIMVKSSNNNTIADNTASSNEWGDGIYLSQSESNKIYRNVLTFNSVHGISLWQSSNNTVYHNRIADNTYQAYDNGDNAWDNGYPSGGNYWGDYLEEDQMCGQDQNLPGGDGIGDLSYNISGGNNRDRYPFQMYIDAPECDGTNIHQVLLFWAVVVVIVVVEVTIAFVLIRKGRKPEEPETS
jgi:nitrous oxidase accessory protein